MPTTVLFAPAPYVGPTDLPYIPLGVSWGSVGQPAGTKPSPPQNNAALAQVCHLATQQVDDELNSEARAGIVTEMLQAPSSRVGVWPNGVARFMTSYRPVRKVVAGAVAPAALFPKGSSAWTSIPAGSAYPEETPGGDDCSSVLIAPQYVGWGLGRYGLAVQMTLVTGWGHTQLTGSYETGVSEVHVDQVCSLVEHRVWILDGPNTETAEVVSVVMDTPADYSALTTYKSGQVALGTDSNVYGALIASGPGSPAGPQAITIGQSTPFWAANPEPAGPGTLTLAAPLIFAHGETVLVTSMLATIRWAAALYAKAQALQRGLATVAMPAEDNKGVSTEEAIDSAIREAVATLAPYRRIL